MKTTRVLLFATVPTFAIPDSEKMGSGLTFIVGANNTGKSSIVEALKFLIPSGSEFSTIQPVNIADDKRNYATKYQVSLELLYGNGQSTRLKTTKDCYTERSGDQYSGVVCHIPSHRIIANNFKNSSYLFSRDQSNFTVDIKKFAAMLVGDLENPRDILDDRILPRLMSIYDNDQLYKKFNHIIKRVLDEQIEWAIGFSTLGGYHLKIKSGMGYHHSEGIGEGIINIFFIPTVLLESEEHNAILVFDEPELFLHPSTQKNLLELFKEYSKKIQIIIATHSPYLLDFESLFNGAIIHRVYKTKDKGILIGSINKEDAVISKIKSLCDNEHNLHIFGLEAREAFFLRDNIILVEGQDDVLLYPQAAKSVDMQFNGSFYGWGVGGAGNFLSLCAIFQQLGYSRIFGILDKDKENEIEKLAPKFKIYKFICIPANDIKKIKKKVQSECKCQNSYNVEQDDTPNIPPLLEKIEDKDTKYGIDKYRVRKEYEEKFKDIINQVNSYFNS